MSSTAPDAGRLNRAAQLSDSAVEDAVTLIHALQERLLQVDQNQQSSLSAQNIRMSAWHAVR